MKVQTNITVDFMVGMLKHREIRIADWRDEDVNAPNRINIKDIEYTDTDRVYIEVNDIFDVRIVRTDEGIVIDVFSINSDTSVASTYVYDNEVITDE